MACWERMDTKQILWWIISSQLTQFLINIWHNWLCLPFWKVFPHFFSSIILTSFPLNLMVTLPWLHLVSPSLHDLQDAEEALGFWLHLSYFSICTCTLGNLIYSVQFKYQFYANVSLVHISRTSYIFLSLNFPGVSGTQSKY